jgi:hypothetical protein
VSGWDYTHEHYELKSGIMHRRRAAAAVVTALCLSSLRLSLGEASAADFATAPSRASVGPATGLAGPAGLRATVFGTPPDDIAPMPAAVPLLEIDAKMPWALQTPTVLWFDRQLRVWFSAQPHPAPLAIVIAGTGADGNAASVATLRGALYGAGYHVLTFPSPTFPRFIVSTSRTGVAGDLQQDGEDLYDAMVRIVRHLPHHPEITAIDVLGYSLGAAHAGIVKSIDARKGELHIRRAVMIEPPVSLFASMARLDALFLSSIGTGEAGIERLYDRLFAQLANFYRAANSLQIDQSDILGAATAVLTTDQEFSAAIALTFRLDLMNVFFAGDLYAKTGVLFNPGSPPRVGQPLDAIERRLRATPFSAYLDRVFFPYYLAHRPHATRESLVADNRLDIIRDELQANQDYYVQTNRDDLILDAEELDWLKRTLGFRIVVYDHGGHLGNLGGRAQIADMLAMLAGQWHGNAP